MLPCHTRNDNNNDDVSNNNKKGDDDDKHLRYCELEYRPVVLPLLQPSKKEPRQQQQQQRYRLLEIRTNHGARHMIRAMLASYGMPIAGDVRYSSGNGNDTTPPLNNRSVALHAYRLQLPSSVQLGLPPPPPPPQQEQSQPSPSLDDQPSTMQRSFCAPIPQQWASYFGWCEQDIQRWNAVVAGNQ